MPIVSVIMGVYKKDNASHFDVAISSVLSQTFTDLELIIICDGELTAEHETVLKKHARGNRRMRIYRNERNQGLARSMNRAVDLANGEFIARMDADDISLPERLGKQVKFMTDNPDCDLSGVYAYEIDEKEDIVFHKRLPVKHDDLVCFFAKRDPFIHPAVIFRKEFFPKVGHYDTSAILGIEDTELWSRAFLAGAKGANIPEFLYKFRSGDELYKRRRGVKNAWPEFKIRLDYVRRARLPLYYYLFPCLVYFAKLMPPSVLKFVYKVARG